MITAERYINLVIDRMPPATPSRDQIAIELRSHIAERLQHGQSLEEVLRQLGDPATLAASYLSAIPLVSASFGARVAAKLLDMLLILTFAVPAFWLAQRGPGGMEVFLVIPTAFLAFIVYTVATELILGQTLGKRVMGLQVVQESGARLTLGRAIVRQLPILFQVFFIDILFVPFTERKQRAFELLSKTRVVVASTARVSMTPAIALAITACLT